MCNDPVHGPALKAVHSDGATPAVSHDVQDLRKAGLGLNACIHTMEGQHAKGPVAGLCGGGKRRRGETR